MHIDNPSAGSRQSRMFPASHRSRSPPHAQEAVRLQEPCSKRAYPRYEVKLSACERLQQCACRLPISILLLFPWLVRLSGVVCRFLLIRKIVLLWLETCVLVRNVLIQRLDEQVVDLLGKVNLRHLQFGQIVGKHGVIEVCQHHWLKNLHVVSGEKT